MRNPGVMSAPGADWNPLGSSERVAGQGGAGAGAFGGLYRQLQGEVMHFIQDGSGMTAMPSLSAEGRWRAAQNRAVADVAPTAAQQAFVDAMTPLAQDAASQLGVAPEVLVAHAALETGWGQQPIRRTDGSDSHNLFGIKASSGWAGDVVASATTEYEADAPVALQARFRAYSGASQSFQDLAQLLSSQPRYRAALGAGSDALAYGQALQRGGYATDPGYAHKLAQVAAQLKGGR